MKQISKALFILMLCVWTNAENNLLSASNPPRTAAIKKVEVPQHRPRHERPQFKNPIMGNRDFQFLYKTIKTLLHIVGIIPLYESTLCIIHTISRLQIY